MQQLCSESVDALVGSRLDFAKAAAGFRDCGSAKRAGGGDAAHKCMTSHGAVAATPQQFHVITRKRQLDSLLEPLSREARAKVVKNLKTELAGHGLQEVVDKYQ